VKDVPSSVLVCGVRYAVVDADEDEIGGVGDNTPPLARIRLARKLARSVRRKTYKHELGHTTSYESGARELLREFAAHPMRLEELLIQTWFPAYDAALGVK